MTYLKDKKYFKVRDHCHYIREYRDAVQSIYKLRYSVPKKIHIVFHKGSNYDYHFIIKKLAEEFKKQLTCSGKILKNTLSWLFQQKKKLEKLLKMENKLQKDILHITIY